MRNLFGIANHKMVQCVEQWLGVNPSVKEHALNTAHCIYDARRQIHMILHDMFMS